MAQEESFRRREIGRVVLVELAISELASAEERRLADEVLLADARLDPDGDDEELRRHAGIVMDDVIVVEDDGGEI